MDSLQLNFTLYQKWRTESISPDPGKLDHPQMLCPVISPVLQLMLNLSIGTDG